MHAPPMHLDPAGHTEVAVEHPPQCAGSVVRSTHVFPHCVSPAGQMHLPAEQLPFVAQVVPHEPQLSWLV